MNESARYARVYIRVCVIDPMAKALVADTCWNTNEKRRIEMLIRGGIRKQWLELGLGPSRTVLIRGSDSEPQVTPMTV